VFRIEHDDVNIAIKILQDGKPCQPARCANISNNKQ